MATPNGSSRKEKKKKHSQPHDKQQCKNCCKNYAGQVEEVPDFCVVNVDQDFLEILLQNDKMKLFHNHIYIKW